MASSALNTITTYHVRSISLPSRPSPQILDVDENLRRLSSTEATTSSSSLSNSLGTLRDLYDSVEGCLQLPHTQQLLTQTSHRSCVDELLNASICFLDVCGTAKDVLAQTKENVQELQSMLRRRRGVESQLINEAEKYLATRKMSKKLISKSLRDLKSNCALSSSETSSEATFSMLRQVNEVTVTLFESLLAFIAGPKAQSKATSWSLVSKLMYKNSKRVSCEEQASDVSEFQKFDSVLHALLRKNIDMDAQNELRKLELSIQDLDEELDSLLRRMIRTRAFLLNLLVE